MSSQRIAAAARDLLNCDGICLAEWAHGTKSHRDACLTLEALFRAVLSERFGRLIEALEFYADKKKRRVTGYDTDPQVVSRWDDGERARAALADDQPRGLRPGGGQPSGRSWYRERTGSEEGAGD